MPLSVSPNASNLVPSSLNNPAIASTLNSVKNNSSLQASALALQSQVSGVNTDANNAKQAIELNQTAQSNASSLTTTIELIRTNPNSANIAQAVKQYAQAVEVANAQLVQEGGGSSNGNLATTRDTWAKAIQNPASTSENLKAAYQSSPLADRAAEAANLTKNQILQQTGTAMLLRATTLPQSILGLLAQ